ncbi:MAG: hypothetical protein FD138_4051 [Planctomycetota bacterium]|nr:MAG: hypothetical protein FD138_4051 [Planctomycetota bacterium]
MPPAFNRSSATNHSCVIALRGLKPTATIKCRSATDGIDRSREERPPPQRGIPMSAQAIGLGHGRNHQGVAPTGRPSSSFVIVDDVFRVGPIESRPVGAV